MIRQRRLVGLLTIVLSAGSLFSCSGWAPVEERWAGATPPVYYRVRPGDTLLEIAWRYGLDYRQIAAWNNLASPDLILAGQRLRLRSKNGATGAPALPARRTPQLAYHQPASQASGPPSSAKVQRRAKPAKPPENTGGPGAAAPRPTGPHGWRWPTEGQVVSHFNGTAERNGIQISGRLGQPIRAVSTGEVVYSGSGIPSLGKLIIVQHPNNLLSAYGYLGRLLVKEGDSVRAGQQIAELGTNDRDRPVLHFEVRRQGKPVDPLRYLRG